MPDADTTRPDSSPLFEYPIAATFGRVLPKNKIYLHAKPTRRVQRLITSEVAQIVWKYKLAQETIRLAAQPSVPEIQVFIVTLKDESAKGLHEDVLRCIDRAIGFPIIFEVVAGNRVQAAAAYKRPSEADSAKWVVGDYLVSDWLASDATRSPLPVALNLGVLYGEMLRRLMPVPARAEESLREQAERVAQIHLLERERAKLDTQLSREKQFNRKVEINAEIRRVQREIDKAAAAHPPK